MYVVVCYDISSHRRRARLHEVLLGYGTPVQKSVFECRLGPAQLRRMRLKTRPFAKKAGESIRYYLLCGSCQARTTEAGVELVEPAGSEDLVV